MCEVAMFGITTYGAMFLGVFAAGATTAIAFTWEYFRKTKAAGKTPEL